VIEQDPGLLKRRIFSFSISTTERNIFEELKYRIENEIKHRVVKLDDVVNAAWRGYLAAALEWGIISVAEHDKLNDLLPTLANDPSVQIFSGYED
jgi:hypothetical protein